MEPSEIIAAIRSSEGSKVKVAITDIDGILRGKIMHRDKFLSVAESSFAARRSADSDCAASNSWRHRALAAIMASRAPLSPDAQRRRDRLHETFNTRYRS